jgi:FkbM family methyltransferase
MSFKAARSHMAERFISFSANCEDVMLHRLFQAVTSGFYVDVGAAHPIFENDTQALHLAGWRGVNVEPNKEFLVELQRLRPDDVNLGVVLSDQSGELTFYEIPGTGLSTLDADQAERLLAAGREVRRRPVAVQTLAQVLEQQNAPNNFELLKIDVEGAEYAVLSGNDWSRFRPQVIIAEATFPESPERRDDKVRHLLQELGWRHVWFDGLNDWFLAEDFQPPEGAFEAPPNIFDNFITRTHAEAEAGCAFYRDVASSRDTEIRHLKQNLEDKDKVLDSLEQALAPYKDILQRAARDVGGRVNLVEQDPVESHAGEGIDPAAAVTAVQNLLAGSARLKNLLVVAEREKERHERALAETQAALVASRREIAMFLSNSEPVAEKPASRVPDLDPSVVSELELRLAEVTAMRDALLSSTSWRLSYPIRLIGKFLK